MDIVTYTNLGCSVFPKEVSSSFPLERNSFVCMFRKCSIKKRNWRACFCNKHTVGNVVFIQATAYNPSSVSNIPQQKPSFLSLEAHAGGMMLHRCTE